MINGCQRVLVPMGALKTWSEDNFAVLAFWRTLFSFVKVLIAGFIALHLL